MKQFQKHMILFVLLILMTAVACSAETAPSGVMPPSAVEGADSEAVPTRSAEIGSADEAAEPGASLPLLPALEPGNTNGIGEPLSGSALADVTFTLAATLPDGEETAVVEQHSFGQLDEARARALADQFGFTGPLYVQKIAPEFAPPEGEAAPIVYTAFSGRRILNISDTGLTYEDRGVLVDYNQRPVFAEVAPLVEAQLKAWGLLDFPYELRELPTGDLAIYRLIDGVAAEQNDFNIFFNQAGEVAYLDYHPGRETAVLGRYPLQTAEMAWQQLQDPQKRELVRYQLLQTAVDDSLAENFVNPRSWAPLSELGQEVHLYMTPAVYEATDGSGLHLVYGEFTLTGDPAELAEIAAHQSDVLHVWGTVGELDGAKTVSPTGWEKLEAMQYENLEGVIAYEAGQALLRTAGGETFILAAAPKDMPEGIEVYVNAAAQRDTGAAYPLVDWLMITEKINWPDAPIESPGEEPAPIKAVTIDSVTLIYFTLYQTLEASPTNDSLLFVPVWKFSGETDQGQIATFWIPAVTAEYLQTP